MKPDGAIAPGTYPQQVLRIACEKCGREGRYPRETIIARYGKDAAMLDVLRELASCANWSISDDPCGAHFPDLP
jgi:hypothetical protein